MGAAPDVGLRVGCPAEAALCIMLEGAEAPEPDPLPVGTVATAAVLGD